MSGQLSNGLTDAINFTFSNPQVVIVELRSPSQLGSRVVFFAGMRGFTMGFSDHPVTVFLRQRAGLPPA